MYSIKTYIPTLSSYCSTKEFNNKDYIDINKYIASNDNEGLADFLEKFINDKITFTVDKLFVIVYLRMLCVGGDLNLKYSDNTGYTANLRVKLTALLEKILTYNKHLVDYNKDDLYIKFKPPTKLFYSNIIELLHDIVVDLAIANKLKDYKSLRSEIKKQILSRLKPEIIVDIKQHIKENTESYPLATIDSNNIFYINYYNNSVIKLVKLLFKNKLTNLYLKLYYMTNNVKFTYSDFCSVTPSETDLLINIYKTVNDIK